MQKLISGLHHFQTRVFQTHQELFERLAQGQNPEALFITCSDSRINPNLITQTNPGDLFILRNAGNIIPPHGAANGGEGATIEFAIAALGVKDIIVCGHSLCGAVKGLLHPELIEKLPSVISWLSHAEATRSIINENYGHLELTEEQRLSVAIQENVLVQLENLKTHPAVAARLARGELNLHGWTYKIETGEVFSYDSNTGQFAAIKEASGVSAIDKPRLSLNRII
ncbi:MAG: carbonic anhydrase [Candidatus Melainabacteria bacterium]|nr:carbonic anhydrase [Candidatus Melainabacteria bacterium]